MSHTPLFRRLPGTLLLVLLAASTASAATAPHPSLLNARSLGMGGATRAVSGPVESARVNPAGLSETRGFFAGGSYATSSAGPYDALSLTLVDNITSPMGGALHYQRTKGEREEREEIGLGLAVGKPGLRWGFTVRYVHGREGPQDAWSNVFDGDVGVLIERPGGTRLAVVGYDLTSTSLAFLERRVALGVAQTGVAGRWDLAADLVRNFEVDFGDGLDLHLGAEYRPAKASPWRARLGQMWRGDNGRDYFSLGGGYTTGTLDLGYAVQIPRQDRAELLHVITVEGSF